MTVTAVSNHPSTAPLAAVAEALAQRDFDRLRGLLDPDIELRALIPPGFREATGAETVTAMLAGWFGSGFAQELIMNEPFVLGDRSGVRFRLRRQLGETVETSKWHVLEQQWFADTGERGIERVSLVCSGNCAEPVPGAAGGVHEFDAGDMGCSDGLPQEFMRRIRSIPVGDVLRVTTKDPAARQDLPSLARMNGHAIAAPEDLGDGRTLFVVERRK